MANKIIPHHQCNWLTQHRDQVIAALDHVIHPDAPAHICRSDHCPAYDQRTLSCKSRRPDRCLHCPANAHDVEPKKRKENRP